MGKSLKKLENSKIGRNPFPGNHKMVSLALLYFHNMLFLGHIQFQEHLCTKKKSAISENILLFSPNKKSLLHIAIEHSISRARKVN